MSYGRSATMARLLAIGCFANFYMNPRTPGRATPPLPPRSDGDDRTQTSSAQQRSPDRVLAHAAGNLGRPRLIYWTLRRLRFRAGERSVDLDRRAWLAGGHSGRRGRA